MVYNLEGIAEFVPVTITLNTPPLDLQSKKKELGEKVYTAGSQIKRHYQEVAEDKEELIPFLKENGSLEDQARQYGNPRRRKFRESFEDYFQRAGIQDVVELDERLDNFEPVLPQNEEEITEENLEEAVKHRNWIPNIGYGAALTSAATGLYFLAFSQAEYSKSAGIGGFAIGVMLAFFSMFLHGENSQYNLKRTVKNHLKTRVRSADSFLNLLRDE